MNGPYVGPRGLLHPSAARRALQGSQPCSSRSRDMCPNMHASIPLIITLLPLSKHTQTYTALPASGPPLLNPVAIGALHALAQLGDTVGRVAIVDVSAFHGDGTAEIVRGFPQVRVCGLLRRACEKVCVLIGREGSRRVLRTGELCVCRYWLVGGREEMRTGGGESCFAWLSGRRARLCAGKKTSSIMYTSAQSAQDAHIQPHTPPQKNTARPPPLLLHPPRPSPFHQQHRCLQWLLLLLLPLRRHGRCGAQYLQRPVDSYSVCGGAGAGARPGSKRQRQQWGSGARTGARGRLVECHGSGLPAGGDGAVGPDAAVV